MEKFSIVPTSKHKVVYRMLTGADAPFLRQQEPKKTSSNSPLTPGTEGLPRTMMEEGSSASEVRSNNLQEASGGKKCFSCGQEGNGGREGVRTCFKCGSLGHLSRDCPGGGMGGNDGEENKEDRKSGKKEEEVPDLSSIPRREANNFTHPIVKKAVQVGEAVIKTTENVVKFAEAMPSNESEQRRREKYSNLMQEATTTTTNEEKGEMECANEQQKDAISSPENKHEKNEDQEKSAVAAAQQFYKRVIAALYVPGVPKSETFQLECWRVLCYEHLFSANSVHHSELLSEFGAPPPLVMVNATTTNNMTATNEEEDGKKESEIAKWEFLSKNSQFFLSNEIFSLQLLRDTEKKFLTRNRNIYFSSRVEKFKAVVGEIQPYAELKRISKEGLRDFRAKFFPYLYKTFEEMKLPTDEQTIWNRKKQECLRGQKLLETEAEMTKKLFEENCTEYHYLNWFENRVEKWFLRCGNISFIEKEITRWDKEHGHRSQGKGSHWEDLGFQRAMPYALALIQQEEIRMGVESQKKRKEEKQSNFCDEKVEVNEKREGGRSSDEVATPETEYDWTAMESLDWMSWWGKCKSMALTEDELRFVQQWISKNGVRSTCQCGAEKNPLPWCCEFAKQVEEVLSVAAGNIHRREEKIVPSVEKIQQELLATEIPPPSSNPSPEAAKTTAEEGRKTNEDNQSKATTTCCSEHNDKKGNEKIKEENEQRPNTSGQTAIVATTLRQLLTEWLQQHQQYHHFVIFCKYIKKLPFLSVVSNVPYKTNYATGELDSVIMDIACNKMLLVMELKASPADVMKAHSQRKKLVSVILKVLNDQIQSNKNDSKVSSDNNPETDSGSAGEGSDYQHQFFSLLSSMENNNDSIPPNNFRSCKEKLNLLRRNNMMIHCQYVHPILALPPKSYPVLRRLFPSSCSGDENSQQANEETTDDTEKVLSNSEASPQMITEEKKSVLIHDSTASSPISATLQQALENPNFTMTAKIEKRLEKAQMNALYHNDEYDPSNLFVMPLTLSDFVPRILSRPLHRYTIVIPEVLPPEELPIPSEFSYLAVRYLSIELSYALSACIRQEFPPQFLEEQILNSDPVVSTPARQTVFQKVLNNMDQYLSCMSFNYTTKQLRDAIADSARRKANRRSARGNNNPNYKRGTPSSSNDDVSLSAASKKPFSTSAESNSIISTNKAQMNTRVSAVISRPSTTTTSASSLPNASSPLLWSPMTTSLPLPRWLVNQFQGDSVSSFWENITEAGYVDVALTPDEIYQELESDDAACSIIIV